MGIESPLGVPVIHRVGRYNHFGDETAHGCRCRRERLPFREGAAFIGLEMTKANPPDCGGRQ